MEIDLLSDDQELATMEGVEEYKPKETPFFFVIDGRKVILGYLSYGLREEREDIRT